MAVFYITRFNIQKFHVLPTEYTHCFVWMAEQGNISVHVFNPLNAELNPICHFLALLGAHHILHVSRIRVNRLVV